MTHKIEIDEAERGLILLSMATLSLLRPGFKYALKEAAIKFDNKGADGDPQMFADFVRWNSPVPQDYSKGGWPEKVAPPVAP